MNVKPLKQPLAGEHILAVHPPMAPYPEPDWRRRPNVVTGRAMSPEAFRREQAVREGRLALSGQRVSPGVVAGLEVAIEWVKAEGQYFFQISPGMGIAASGEDVILHRAVRINLTSIPLVDVPPSGEIPAEFSSLTEILKDDGTLEGGIQAELAVLLLVPIVAEQAGASESTDPCEQDPEEYSFEDRRLIEGCRIVLCAWPSFWPLPATLADANARNLAAYDIFQREQALPPESVLPWAEIGVPIALVGLRFDPAVLDEGVLLSRINPLFVDRAAVVRKGGAPRGRTPLVPGRGNPLLWQARIQQFSEQLTGLVDNGTLDGPVSGKCFRYLPPVGLLPKSLLKAVEDPSASFPWETTPPWKVACDRTFFPNHLAIEAVPVPFEQLDTVVAASASLAPFDKSAVKIGRMRLLVPVPEADFEPRLLKTEHVDADFVNAPATALERLSVFLKRREIVRGELDIIYDAISGEGDHFPKALDEKERLDETEYVSTTEPTDPAEASYGVTDGRIAPVEQALDKWFSGHIEELQLLDGQTSSALDAVSWPGRIHLVAFNSDRKQLLHRWFDKRWSPWKVIYGGLDFDGRPVAVSWGPGRLDVFVRLKDVTKGVLHFYFEGGWKGPQTLAGLQPTQGFTACSGGPGRLDVFALQWNDASKTLEIFHQSFSNGKWQSVDKLPLVGIGGGRIEACAWGPGRLDVFLVGSQPQQTLHVWKQDASAWTVGESQPGEQYRGNVFIGSTALGRVDVIHMRDVAMSNEVCHFWFDGQEWHDEGKIDRGAYWGKNAASFAPGRIDIIGTVDDKLSHKAFDGTWHAWEAFTSEPDGHAAALCAGAFGRLDLFLNGLHGELSHLVRAPRMARIVALEHGIAGLVSTLEAQSRRIDDWIDGSFLRAQTSIRTVRQRMTEGGTVSRFAASPALGAVWGEPPIAARADIKTYFARIKLPAPGGTPPPPTVPSSDAVEALESAASFKVDIVEYLVALVKELDFDVTGVIVPGFAIYKGGEIVSTKGRVARESLNLADLVKSEAALRDALARIDNEPGQADGWDEHRYFAESIVLLDGVVVLMRNMERRLKVHGQMIASLQALLASLKKQAAQAEKRLQELADDIAEARQDVVVARALLAEESARIAAINARRLAVLKERVRFLVFHRPRERDLNLDTPARVLDPAFTKAVLPAALANTAAAPPELWSIIALLREVPLGWLSSGRDLLRGLDRFDLIQLVIEEARSRATSRVPPKLTIAAAARPLFAQGITKAFAAQERIIAQQRLFTASFDLFFFGGRGWLELQQKALELVSISDLTGVDHGRSDVAHKAAAEIEHIAKVATYLYLRFGEVLPIIRLQWAEQMSQYDDVVSLRRLSRLPMWNQIDVTARREMQMLVDWLFQHIDPAHQNAVTLMNDIVRVCMLLASHAPVNEIIAGEVISDTPVKIGAHLDVAVDISRIRAGMHVFLTAESHTVQAIVEDLGAGKARARVVSASAPSILIAAKTAAKFSEPERGGGKLLPHVGFARQ